MRFKSEAVSKIYLCDLCGEEVFNRKERKAGAKNAKKLFENYFFACEIRESDENKEKTFK